MLRTQLYRWWCQRFCSVSSLVLRARSPFEFSVRQDNSSPALPPATPWTPLGRSLYTGRLRPASRHARSGVVNGAVKCQQISAETVTPRWRTDTDIHVLVGPLSGMDSIKNGQPGTQLPVDFNAAYNGSTLPNGLTNPVFNLAQPQNNNGAVTDPPR